MQASDCIFRTPEGTDFLFFTKNLGVEDPERQFVIPFPVPQSGSPQKTLGGTAQALSEGKF